MSETARNLATWEDLLATPEDGLKYEIIDGQLEAQPSPRPRHNRAQAALTESIYGPFDRGRGGPGGWWILIETDVMLGPNDIVAPDLVGWRRERVPEFPEEQPIMARPDWVCEIVSPSGKARDRVKKADLYLASGIPHYWIVDPAERTLEAYVARDGAWVRHGAWTDGNVARILPFEAVEIEVGGLFPPISTKPSG